MKVKLSKRFQNEFNSVVDYILDNFGASSAKEFTDSVKIRISWIAENPLVGRCEPLLSNRKIEYRCLIVSKHNKVIYYTGGSTIHIVDLWDMRRDPKTLINRVK